MARLSSWMLLFTSTIVLTDEAFAPNPIHGNNQELSPSGRRQVVGASGVRLGAPMSKNPVSQNFNSDLSLANQQNDHKQGKQDSFTEKPEINSARLQIHSATQSEIVPQRGVQGDGQSPKTTPDIHQHRQPTQDNQQRNQPIQLSTQDEQSSQQATQGHQSSQKDQREDKTKNKDENNNNNNCGGGCGCCCGTNNCGTNNNNNNEGNGNGNGNNNKNNKNNNCCGCCCCCHPCCSPCGCCCQPCCCCPQCCHQHDCCVHHVHHIAHHECPCACTQPCCCECTQLCGCGCAQPCGCGCGYGGGFLDPLCGGSCGCAAPCGCGGCGCGCGCPFPCCFTNECGGYHYDIFAIDKEDSDKKEGKSKTEEENGDRRQVILTSGYLFPAYRHVRSFQFLKRTKVPYSKRIHERIARLRRHVTPFPFQ